ncbi:MAG: hypothetical protein WC816_04660 [Sphingomonas sp.]
MRYLGLAARQWAGLGIVCVMSALLSGCIWGSQRPLFTPDPSTPVPIESGSYWLDPGFGLNSTSKTRIEVTRLPSGYFLIRSDGKYDQQIAFRPLPVPGRTLWMTQLLINPEQSSFDTVGTDLVVFGLMERTAKGLVGKYFLECKGSEALVAKAGGVALDDDKGCVFGDLPSLERALSAYARQHPVLAGETSTLTRIKR